MTQIIKVPDELRGQKIVPYLEHCVNVETLAIKERWHIEKFLNQPFNTSMLVNPYESGDITYDMASFEWVEAETNRLFEGWEKRKGLLSIFSIDGKLKLAEYEINKFTVYELVQKDEYYEKKIFEFLTVKSLNDFITLCQLAGVDLGVWK